MTGWLGLLMLAALSLAALLLLGARGAMLQLCAATLMFGAAGYALQGSPGLPGAARPAVRAERPVPLTEARHAFFGSFSAEESWLRISEGLARAGKSEDAVNILTNAVRRYPGSTHLWIGLGNALVEQAHGLTPPAEYAYRRAAEMSLGRPAAPFFYGIALARSGNPQAAVAIWRNILAGAPQEASWRPLVEGGIAALTSPAVRQSP